MLDIDREPDVQLTAAQSKARWDRIRAANARILADRVELQRAGRAEKQRIMAERAEQQRIAAERAEPAESAGRERKRNRDRDREWQRAYRAAHRDEDLERKRGYYAKNREAVLERRRRNRALDSGRA